MEKSCTLLVHFDKGTSALANEIKEALEGNDVEAMKKAIMILLNGDTIPQLFITIIRYVLPSEDHAVQKLLLLYLEIIDKTDSRGKVLPEMILICQNLRNNLQSPNEYIRGVTLRFLCRDRRFWRIWSTATRLFDGTPSAPVYRLPQGEQLLVRSSLLKLKLTRLC